MQGDDDKSPQNIQFGDRLGLADVHADVLADLLARTPADVLGTDTDVNGISLTRQISVPAIWTDKQKHVMDKAAKEANVARESGTTKAELREEPFYSAVVCK